MIAVEKALAKLIGEYEFVIIPGFGALLCNHIPASFDPSSGYFNPPFKKLAFNEYLKLDDGTLANFISRHEQVTHVAAVEYVKQFSDQLRSELMATDQVSIAGIGEFNKNVEGKLVFEPFTENHFKDEWYGFQPVRASVATLAARPINTRFNEVPVAESEVEVVEDEEPRTYSLRWLRGVAAAAVILLLCGLSVFLVNSRDGDIQSTLNPFRAIFESKSAIVAEQTAIVPEETKSAILAVASEATPDSIARPVVPNENVAPVASVDVPETAAAPVVSKTKFYVIAGAFKGSKSANVMLADLQAHGFENASIVPGTKYSTKYKVAINAFDTEKEAYNASVQLKKSIGVQGWIFKKK